MADQTPERTLTQEEHDAYKEAKEQMSQLDTNGTYDANNPHHRLFNFTFDGTWQDRDFNPDYDPSNAHNNTNADIIEDLVDDRTSRVSSKYFEGVGTDGPADSVFGGSTGFGVVERAEDAYDKLEEQVRDWHQSDPHAEIHITTAAFSRGNASQLLFLQMVHEQGITDENGNYIIKPGEIKVDLAFFMDPVFEGAEHVIKGGAPESIEKNIVEVHAKYEDRNFFGSDTLFNPDHPDDPAIQHIPLAGSHSDFPGGNNRNGVGQAFKTPFGQLKIGYDSLLGVVPF